MPRTLRRWKVAAVQMTATDDRDRNLAAAVRLARRAAAAGADLVAFPENFTYLHSGTGPVPCAEAPDGPLVNRLAGLARDLGCYLLAGSIPERIPRSRRVHNTSILFDRSGRPVAAYRKIHLFDVEVPGRVSIRESRTVAAGDRPVVVTTPLGRLGLTICYDLRFPELYRRLARRGSQVIFVPAAFTAFTGRFHWMPLLRARAIENQCWIVAPAQWGRHSRTRSSHGETMVLDPWGDIVARKKTGEGIVTATIDLDRIAEVRAALPAQRHARHDLFDRGSPSRSRTSSTRGRSSASQPSQRSTKRR